MPTLPKGAEHILAVQGLGVSYGDALALRDVSLTVCAGEVVGVVGESGSGKSTLLRAVAHLLPPTAVVTGGSVAFGGRDITEAPRRLMAQLRGTDIAYLFQNGESSLDPLFTVGQQFDEVMRSHGSRPDRTRQRTLLRRMGFEDDERVLDALPCQLSGGQCQRVALAFALAGHPKLLLADEPTSALDGEAQARVVALLRDLNERERLAVLLVSHDIDLVASLSDTLCVMRDGCVVEEGPTAQVMESPRAAYTRELIASVPRLTPEGRRRLCCL